MSLKPPIPESGSQPNSELLFVDMLNKAPYSPNIEQTEDAFNHMVHTTKQTHSPIGEIIVRPYKNYYEVVFGWDYLQAFQEAVVAPKVPVTLYHYNDAEAVRVSIQMHDAYYGLNPIDLAEIYQQARQHFDWKHSDLSKALHMKASTLSNRLKLNDLDNALKKWVKSGKLSIEPAKALSRLPNKEQIRLAKLSIKYDWNTRQLYQHISPNWQPKNNLMPTKSPSIKKDRDHQRLEKKLGEVIGLPLDLDLNPVKQYEGKMNIKFHSLDELTGFIEKLSKKSEQTNQWKGDILFTIEGLNHLDGILQDLRPDEQD